MPPRKRKVKAPAVDEDANASDGEEAGPSRGRKTARSTRGLVSSFFASTTGGSNKTVADLRLDHSDETELRDVLSKLPEKHRKEKAAIATRLEQQFGQWWAQMRAGNSLLLYGFGSKKEILNKFAKSHTLDGACLAIDGLQPGLTARRIVVQAAALTKLVEPKDYRNYDKVQLFDLIQSENPHRHIYIIIHNIDGQGLRDAASQRLLSELAALPNVHVAASVDHANAPLLWDMQNKDRFGWVWYNATNYAPYLSEVLAAGIPSLLSGRSDEVTRQSAEVVLASLSNSAREVFRIIADTQLDPEGEGGISFQQLFTSCRERFLVSNEMLLRAFLTEFKDHDLVVTKRGQEGTDVMQIPLSNEALLKVLENMVHMTGGAGGS